MQEQQDGVRAYEKNARLFGACGIIYLTLAGVFGVVHYKIVAIVFVCIAIAHLAFSGFWVYHSMQAKRLRRHQRPSS